MWQNTDAADTTRSAAACRSACVQGKTNSNNYSYSKQYKRYIPHTTATASPQKTGKVCNNTRRQQQGCTACNFQFSRVAVQIIAAVNSMWQRRDGILYEYMGTNRYCCLQGAVDLNKQRQPMDWSCGLDAAGPCARACVCACCPVYFGLC